MLFRKRKEDTIPVYNITTDRLNEIIKHNLLKRCPQNTDGSYTIFVRKDFNTPDLPDFGVLRTEKGYNIDCFECGIYGDGSVQLTIPNVPNTKTKLCYVYE